MMLQSHLCRVVLIAAATAVQTLIAGGAASASVVEFNSLSSFDAATSGRSNIDLSSQAFFEFGTNTATFAGDKFKANRDLYDLGGSFGGYGVAFLSTENVSGNFSSSTLTITPKTGITAFGFDYGSYTDPPTSLQITINGGSPINLTTPTTSGTFVGFTDTTNITTIVLTGLGTDTVFDLFNIVQGTAVTPLPAAFPLLAAGLGVLGLLSRRRKHQSTAVPAA